MIMEKQSVFVVSAAKQIDAVALVIAEREQLVREREWELLRLAVAAQPTPLSRFRIPHSYAIVQRRAPFA